MAKNQSSSGSGLVAAGLALSLGLLTFSTLYIFGKRIWWFPDSISALGDAIDAQFNRTLIVCGIVFLLAHLGLGYVILRYRDRGGRAHYSHGNNTLEILWTAATAVMFVGLGFAAERSWAEMHFVGAAPGALQVEVTAEQFAWNFRYAGPEGVGQFGRTDPKLIDPSAGNPIGLDSSDPAAADDIVTPVMAVPVNQEVEVTLRSKDVIHSFFVRELRLKQDAVPGMAIKVHFTANRVGRYEIACAELCGMQHYKMRTWLQVMPEAEFKNWLRQQAAP